MSKAYDAEMIAGIVEGDVPRGFYEKFWATPKMIFGDDPDKKVLRQMVYIRTYLDDLSDLLVYKLRIARSEAEEIVLEFIHSLFASPAIRENAWGKYRYYIGVAVTRFAIRGLRQKARKEKRRLPVLQWMAIGLAEIEDILFNGIFNVELRQIQRALEDGTIDEYLRRGVRLGEVADNDVTAWMLMVHEHLLSPQIAERLGNLSPRGVRHALDRVERYFRKHARELRVMLRSL